MVGRRILRLLHRLQLQLEQQKASEVALDPLRLLGLKAAMARGSEDQAMVSTRVASL